MIASAPKGVLSPGPVLLPDLIDTALVRACRVGVDNGELTEVHLNRVQALLAQRRNLDYRESALAFSYSFYPLNFAKVLVGLRTLKIEPALDKVLRVFDFGCGSGAASAAAVAYLKALLPSRKIELTGIDRSAEQLELFESVSGPFIKATGTKVRLIRSSIESLDFLNKNTPSLIVGSYVLCELSQKLRSAVMQGLSQAGAPYVFVDKQVEDWSSNLISNHSIHALSMDGVDIRAHYPAALGFMTKPRRLS